MRNYTDLRPPANLIELLLRAAVADDGEGGPWLWVSRSLDLLASTHHLHTTADVQPDKFRMEMLSGAEALAFAHTHNWRSILHPSVSEIKALIVQAMLVNNVTDWANHYDAWVQWAVSEEAMIERAHRMADAKAAARALRWTLAEQWLRR